MGILIVFLYIAFCACFATTHSANVDYENTQVWGLALDSAARLPVRYLHIQPYDRKNKM